LLACGILAGSGSPGRAGAPVAPSLFEADASTRSSLFAQSAAQILDRDFTRSDVAFLLIDARTGALLASRWQDPQKSIAMGSLVKPFTALAYAEQHQFRYPTHICRGTRSGCWLPGGHGNIEITSAISGSCNSYFRMLTANMKGDDVAPVARRFGLEEPGAELAGPALCGIGNLWLTSPLRLSRAYLELVRRRNQPGVSELVAGMAQSAREGTGSQVGRLLEHSHALAKTGTAGYDGFVVVVVPAEQPEMLLLVRVHGVSGARASATAGRMLQRIEE